MGRSYSRLFAILKDINTTGAGLTYKDAVSSFTNGRTESLSDLSDFELRELERTLQNTVPSGIRQARINPVHDATRKAIISQFLSIGKTVEDAKHWAENYGVFGNKKLFNDYDGQELYQLMQNAKKMKKDFIKAVNKKLLQ